MDAAARLAVSLLCDAAELTAERDRHCRDPWDGARLALSALRAWSNGTGSLQAVELAYKPCRMGAAWREIRCAVDVARGEARRDHPSLDSADAHALFLGEVIG